MATSKRDQIIKEASQIIAYEGMDSFSLSVLAERVGLSKATLYNYFRSRDEIIEAIIKEGHSAFMKKGFRLNLSGSVSDVLFSAASHWMDIFLSDEHTPWLRVVFSMHLVNGLCADEYRSITLMLASQAQVVISSFGLKVQYQNTLTELFSSLLLSRLERTLEGEEINLEEDIGGMAAIIGKLK